MSGRAREDEATLLLACWTEIKRRYPDHLVFFEQGDFYEALSFDAMRAGQVLDIVLTKKRFGTKDISMCGVPRHCIDSYVHHLREAGCGVVLCTLRPSIYVTFVSWPVLAETGYTEPPWPPRGEDFRPIFHLAGS